MKKLSFLFGILLCFLCLTGCKTNYESKVEKVGYLNIDDEVTKVSNEDDYKALIGKYELASHNTISINTFNSVDFNSNSIIILYISVSSGSTTVKYSDISIENDTLTLIINEEKQQIQTADMSGWIIQVVLTDSKISNVTNYRYKINEI